MSRFWGQRVEPGTVVEMALEDISLHLSQAALAPGAKGTSVLFARTAKTDGAFALCQLTAGKQPHTTIDLTFFPGDERVDLIVQGDAAVHVTGADRGKAMRPQRRSHARARHCRHVNGGDGGRG